MDIKRNDLKRMIMESMASDRLSSLLERPELLDEKSILKNKYPFKAIYIFGPAGAGKSYISANLLNFSFSYFLGVIV